MKSKSWAAGIGVLFLLCLGLSLWLFRPGQQAAKAEIWSDGVLVEVLDLAEDRQLTVESAYGSNVITVQEGKIGVTQADCPDGLCMGRGMCAGGREIVCLPNRLIIRFLGEQTLDGVAG